MSMRRNTMHPGLQNFRIALPPKTHRIAATCAEVDCDHYLNGWQTRVAVNSPQEIYIRKKSGRRWRLRETGESFLTFEFEAGQRCFREHDRLSGRPPWYIYETAHGKQMHRPEDWMEHAHEEIDKQFREKAQ